MTPTIGWCAFLSTCIALVTISLVSPWALSDTGNAFLKGFVNHELIAFLGVIVTITLASAANVHLALNQLEDRANDARLNHCGFPRSRAIIKQSSYRLIGILVFAVLVVVAKPVAVLASTDRPVVEALFNSAALASLLCSVLILIDITNMALAIGPHPPAPPPPE